VVVGGGGGVAQEVVFVVVRVALEVVGGEVVERSRSSIK